MKTSKSRLYSSSSLYTGFIASVAFSIAGFGNISDALANPQGATVTSGQISITQNGTNEIITQSTNNAIINWQNFDILNGESTRFIQPSSGSVALNRINNGNPTEILGSLSANGHLMLINPNGIFFGAGSTVNVGGLIASTADISDKNFNAGNYKFNHAGNPNATIINKGVITAAQGGLIALVAPGVENDGIISAKVGTVALGAAKTFTIDFYGDNLYSFSLGAPTTAHTKDANGNTLSAALVNKGLISAQGGNVYMTARAAGSLVNDVINNTGIIDATASHKGKGGSIVIDGGNNGTVNIAGNLNVSGKHAGQTGGNITVVGKHITLESTASLNASGAAGGGQVNVGGSAHGTGPLHNADTVTDDAGSVINVSALDNGNGGTAVLWSNVDTEFHGNILARGGINGGNGGSVETSGHYLNATGVVNASAANGAAGTWLLDPWNITIEDNSGSNVNNNGGPGFKATGTSIVDTSLLDAALTGGTNITIKTGAAGSTGADAGVITVANNVVSTGSANLTLDAASNIILNSNVGISAGAGQTLGVTLDAGNNIVLNSGSSINSGGGKVVLNADTGNVGNGYIYMDSGSSIHSNGGNITLSGASGDVNFGGVSVGNYYGGGATIDASGTTTGGNIKITGTAATSNGTYWDGIDVVSGSQISTNNKGTITLVGNSSSGDSSSTGGNSSGIYIRNSSVTAQDGNINITGTGLGTGAIPDFGIIFDNGTVSTNGTGNIRLIGTGAAGAAGIVSGGYGYNAATLGGASDQGNITLNADSLSLADDTIQTTKTVTFAPLTASTTVGVNDAGSALDITQALLNSINAPTVTIGNKADTGILTAGTFTWENALTALNLVTGGDIVINGSITNTNTTAGTLSAHAGGNITVNSTGSISSTGAATGVTLDADVAGAGGYIFMDTGSSIVSDGGNITLGGGSNAFNTAAVSGNSGLGGITLNGNNTLDARGSSKGGNISLLGTAYQGDSPLDGLDIYGGATIETNHAGNITLNGTGATGNSGGYNSEGLNLQDATISAEKGNINLTGTAKGTTLIDYGIEFDDNTITTTSGNITLTGTGSSGAQGIYNNIGYNTIGAAGSTETGTIQFNGDYFTLANNTIQTKGNINILPTGTGTTEIVGDNSNISAGKTLTINASNGSLTFIEDFVNLAGNTISIISPDTVTFKPLTTTTTVGVNDSGSALDITQALLNSISAPTVTIGDKADTAALTAASFSWENALAVLNLITGGDVNVNGTITNANANTGTLSVQAGGNINVNTGASFSSTGNATDVILASGGAVSMGSGSSINSNGGDITLGGNGGGAAVSAIDGTAGITLNNAALNASGGTITLTGTGDASGVLSGNDGILLANGSTIQTNGAGQINLTGIGGGNAGNSGFNNGVEIHGSGTQVSAVDGNITISGTGGLDTGNIDEGVAIYGGGNVQSNGKGDININGIGGGTGVSTDDIGVGIYAIALNDGTGIFSNASGNVNINGYTGTQNSGSSTDYYNAAVYINAPVHSVDGNILIQGNTGGTGTLNTTAGSGNFGITTHNATDIAASGLGSVTLEGVAAGSDATNTGISLNDGARIATNSGDLTISGTGNGASSGIVVALGSDTPNVSSTISSNTGNINVNTGSGDLTSTSSNINTSGNITLASNGNETLTDGNVTAGGAVNINANNNLSITGTAISGGSITIDPTNVSLSNLTLNTSGGDEDIQALNDITLSNVQINTSGGNVILGADGSGISGAVALTSGTSIVSDNGNIAVGAGATGLGVAKGDAANPQGVLLDNATLNSGSGNISVSGHGYSNNAVANLDGVLIENGSQIASTSGNITLHGVGGKGNVDGFNYSDVGVYLRDSSVSTTNGAVTITGSGGSGTSSYNAGIALDQNASITSTGTGVGVGTVSLLGIGGANSFGGYGVSCELCTMSTVDGNLNVAGISTGTASSLYNDGVVLYSPSSSLSVTGAGNLIVTGKAGNGGADIRFGGASIGSATDTGNIVFNANNLLIDSNPTITTGGRVVFAPRTVGTTIGFGGTSNTSGSSLYISQALMDSINAPIVTIGKSLVSGLLTTDSFNWESTLNRLNLIGGDILVGGAITNATATNGTVVATASGNINFNSAGAINSTNAATNVILTADTGSIFMDTGSSILSNGGNISMTGVSNDVNLPGVSIGNYYGGAATVDASGATTGGNIHIAGTAAIGSTEWDGIDIVSGSQISTNHNGNVVFVGYGSTGDNTSSGGNSNGVYLRNSSVTTQNGNINIAGTGQGTGSTPDYGIVFDNGSVTTTGTGNIYLNGTGAAGAAGILSGSNGYGSATIGGNSDLGNIGLKGNVISLTDATINTGGTGNIYLYATDNALYSAGSINSAQGNIGIRGATTLSENVTSAGGNIYFKDALTLGSDPTVSSGGGSVNFASTVDGAYDLNVNSGTGTTRFKGIVGGITPLANLDIIADKLFFAGNVSGTGMLTIMPSTSTLAVNLNNGNSGLFLSTAEINDIQSDWANIVIGNSVDTGLLSMGTATWKSPVDFFTANSGNIDVNGKQTGTGPASLTFSGPTTLAANITTQGGDILFNDEVTLGQGVTLNSHNGDVTFVGTVDGPHSLAVNSGTGTTAFDSNVGNNTALNNLTITADNLTFSKKLFGTGVLTIAPSTSNLAINLNNGNSGLFLSTAEINRIQSDWAGINIGNVADSGVMTLGKATWKSPVDFITGNTGNIVVNGDQTGTGVASLTFSGPTLLSANATTNGGDILFNDAVILGKSDTVDSGNGNVTFDGTVNGAHNLTVDAGTGTTTFGAKVGGATALKNLTVSADHLVIDHKIFSTGTVLIEPGSVGTTVGLNDAGSTLDITQKMMNRIHAPTVTLGNIADTGTLTTGAFKWEKSLHNLNLITGGNIVVAGNTVDSIKHDVALLMQAGGNINIDSNSVISSSKGMMNVTADADANGTGGYIFMDTNSSIASNGGNIILGGGANPLSDYAVSGDTNFSGITLNDATLDAHGLSTGGNISLNGAAFNGDTALAGISIASGSNLITNNGGTITLNGLGSTLTTTGSEGVSVQGSNLSAENGNITINGTGEGTTATSNYGIALVDNNINTTNSSTLLTGNNVLVNNNVVTTGADGFDISNSSNITLTQNTLTSTSGVGTGINLNSDSGTTTITGNTLNNFGTGININQLDNVQFASNIVTGFNGPFTIDLVTGAVSGTNGSVGVQVTNSNNVSFLNDQFISNLVGIYLDGSPNAKLSQVSLLDNGIGLLVQDGSGTHFSSNELVGNTTFTGGTIGIVLDGPGASMSFDTTQPSSHFQSQTYYFVLADGAMDGKVLDASQQIFNGARASGFTFGPLGQLADAESRTIDSHNNAGVGTVFYRFDPSAFDNEELQNSVDSALGKALFSYAGQTFGRFVPSLSIQTVNLSLLASGGPSVFANLSPAAGGDNAAALGNLSPAAGGDTATTLASLSPSAGGADSCGNGFLGGGYTLSYSAGSCVK